MQLSVIIVSYNTKELTLKTLASIEKSLTKNSSLAKDLEVIVVDNRSTDGSFEALKKFQSESFNLKVVDGKENLGFGKANNLGFKYATGQYILFLNSDTTVHAGALEKLVTYYQNHQQDKKKLGFLAAQLLNVDGSWQSQGGDLPNLFTIFNTMFFLDDLPVIGKLLPAVQHTGRRFMAAEVERKPIIKKGWVAGTAMMIYRDLFEDTHGFNPEIFLYGEDQEYCYRLHQLGYNHYILPAAQITHLGSASSSSKRAICGEIAGYFYFFRQYKSANQLVYLKAILWLAMMLRYVIFSLKKDQTRAQIYAEAVLQVEKEKTA